MNYVHHYDGLMALKTQHFKMRRLTTIQDSTHWNTNMDGYGINFDARWPQDHTQHLYLHVANLLFVLICLSSLLSMFLDPTNIDDSVRTCLWLMFITIPTYLDEYYNLTIVFDVLMFFDWSSAGDFGFLIPPSVLILPISWYVYSSSNSCMLSQWTGGQRTINWWLRQ